MRRLAAFVLSIGCAPEDVEPPRPRLEIIVDDNGIPHIYGRTDHDAFHGAGYQMASDRLFHMETTRRRAYGTLAAVLGSEARGDDELSRLFDFAGWGRKHAELMRSEARPTHDLIVAWTEGVNARIAENSTPLRFEIVPQPWTVEDVLTIATMTGFGNDLTFDAEIFATIAFQFYPEALSKVQMFRPARDVFTTVYDSPRSAVWPGSSPEPAIPRRASARDLARTMDTLARLHRMRTGMGSNNWAVSGAHTESGRPLIAGDPHLDWDIPGIFYALHINSKEQEGTIDAAGFSFVGTPGISVGQTDRVVWTPTTAFADTMDVWAVQRPDPDHVIIGGQTLPIVRREEIIAVRDSEDVRLVAESVDGYGVILPSTLVPIPVGEEGDVLLMNWTGFEPQAFANLLDFNRVQSVDEYDQAVLGFGANFNFVAADANGIVHRVGTKVPRRQPAADREPWLVLDGDDIGSLWTGEMLTPDELPHGRGGERGFIVTANNDPFGFTRDGDLTNDPYYFGAFFAPGWRAARAEGELARMIGEGPLTIEHMQALQTDVHSSMADDLLPILEEAWARVGSDPALAEFEGREDLGTLVAALSAWDREMRADSGEALVMHAYIQMVTRRAIGDDIELVFLRAMEMQPIFMMKIATMAMRGAYPMGDDTLQEGRSSLALLALADVADFLVTRYGGVDPSLYTLGSMRSSHMNGTTGRGIDRGKFPTHGSEDTLDVAAYSTFFDAQGDVLPESITKHGPIFRHNATFTEDGTPQLWFDMPLGNVALPESPHWQDLHDDWLNGRYRRFWYTRDEVDEHAESSYTLLE
jgi:penicillin amidase